MEKLTENRNPDSGRIDATLIFRPAGGWRASIFPLINLNIPEEAGAYWWR